MKCSFEYDFCLIPCEFFNPETGDCSTVIIDKKIPKTCFLSGQVSNIPYWRAYLTFLFWEFILTLAGYEVYNPCREIPKKTKWLRAMAICVNELKSKSRVFFIPGYRKSQGALIERDHAIFESKEYALKRLRRKDYIRFQIQRWEFVKQTKPEFDKDLQEKFIKAVQNLMEE